MEEGVATHSSILAWRIPWTEEPGRLQSTGHKEADTTEVTAHTHAQRAVVWREAPLRSGDFQKRDTANPQPRWKLGE